MSLRLRLLRPILRRAVKPLLNFTPSPQRARRGFRWGARLFVRRVPFVVKLPQTVHAADHWLRMLWVWSGPIHNRSVVLYFHGGGYIVGSPETHADMVAKMCKRVGLRAVLPAYRLAPDHPAPAQLNDGLAAWHALRDAGYAPEQIVLAGDSAGGGLALCVLAVVCQRGEPPAACVCFSPWCDLTLSGDSLRSNASGDLLLPVGRITELRDYVVGDGDADHPGVSPLFAEFPNCPPVLIQASDTEILLSDANRMAASLSAQGAPVTLDVWQDMPHVWHIFQGTLPEADRALSQAADFMAQHLPSSLPHEN